MVGCAKNSSQSVTHGDGDPSLGLSALNPKHHKSSTLTKPNEFYANERASMRRDIGALKVWQLTPNKDNYLHTNDDPSPTLDPTPNPTLTHLNPNQNDKSEPSEYGNIVLMEGGGGNGLGSSPKPKLLVGVPKIAPNPSHTMTTFMTL